MVSNDLFLFRRKMTSSTHYQYIAAFFYAWIHFIFWWWISDILANSLQFIISLSRQLGLIFHMGSFSICAFLCMLNNHHSCSCCYKVLLLLFVYYLIFCYLFFHNILRQLWFILKTTSVNTCVLSEWSVDLLNRISRFCFIWKPL